MQLLVVSSFLSATLAVSAPTGSTQADANLAWSKHYAQAKQMAEREHRPLLVVVEDKNAPDGRLAENLAADPKYTDLLKQYSLCRMDVNTPYGQRVAEAFGATTFPMTVITDNSANVVTFRAEGKMEANAWQKAIAGFGRSNTLTTSTTATTAGALASDRAASSAWQPQRVEASKIITTWPSVQAQPVSSCPNCIRNPSFYYYQ